MAKVTLVDGEPAEPGTPVVDAEDPGLLGVGVYETLRTYEHEPFAVELHLDRLCSGASALGLDVERDALGREIAQAARAATRGLTVTEEISLRIILTGAGRRIVIAGPLIRPPRLVRAVTLPWRRPAGTPLAGVKAASTAGTRIASRHVLAQGVDDGIWVTPEGMVSEALAACVFAVLGGRLVTPPLTDGALPGVTRALLLRLGAEERSFPVAALSAADEAFLAATSFPARALVEVDGRAVGDGTPGQVTRRIGERFHIEALALVAR